MTHLQKTARHLRTFSLNSWKLRAAIIPLLALSPASAQQPFLALWEYTTGGLVASSPAMGPDGTIYIGSSDNRLHAVSGSGDALWTFPTGDWVDSTPAIAADGTIVVGSWDGFVYALERDGTLRWSYETAGPVIGSPAIDGDVVIVGGTDGFLYGLELATGDLAWVYLADAILESSAATDGAGIVYVAGRDGTLHAVNSADGTGVWIHEVSAAQDQLPIIGSPAVTDDGNVVVGLGTGDVIALDTNGNELWTFSTGDSVESQPVVDALGNVYFASTDGVLYSVDSSGFLNWSALLGRMYGSGPAIGREGSIYAIADSQVSNGSILYQLDASGFTTDSVDLTDFNDSSPLLTPDGYLYMAGFDGVLRKFDPAEPLAESVWPQFRQTPQRRAAMPAYLSPFKQWIVDELGSDLAETLPQNEDTDDDGISLLEEFFMGLSPTLPDVAPMAMSVDGNVVNVSLVKRAAAVDVAVFFESGETLTELGNENSLPEIIPGTDPTLLEINASLDLDNMSGNGFGRFRLELR